MNPKKVAFITCVNNEDIYKESLFYIQHLTMPPGYTYECIAVRGAPSMARGHNIGMSQTDAKYKVYLHQDLNIVEPDFVPKMLQIFDADANIGVMGVAGATSLPLEGVWWVGTETFGCVYHEDHDIGRSHASTFSKAPAPDALYVPAKALDGLLLATQYDLVWRDDLFDHWHFYDLSQCFEFLRKDYAVVIANQWENGVEEPWCLHTGRGIPEENWERARIAFLQEYQDILSPASNT